MDWKRGPIIGRGSSAAVSLATTDAGDIFAVKSTDLSTSAVLQKEQLFLSQLSSEYIIQYMGFEVSYEHNKPMYNLFMEYAAGGTVSDVIKKQGGSLDESLIRSYTNQILLGLDYLHSNNLVHCDIKCQNFLVCNDGVKIGDLGCAKTATTSEFSGTPVFMGPEVARGEEQGFPADVWALGCSVIEMATGANPWPEMNDAVSALYRIGYSGDIPEIPKLLPEEGKDFLEKCLKIDAKERWTIKELLQHPFVNNLNSGSETRKSPTSTLDQGFWEALEVPESSPAMTQMVNFSGESPAKRMRRLVEATGLPNWEDEEDWITVRSNHIDETEFEFDHGELTQSFSFLNFSFEEEVESSVIDEDFWVFENLVDETESVTMVVVSRVVDFDYINNYISFLVNLNKTFLVLLMLLDGYSFANSILITPKYLLCVRSHVS